jgi:hypothetical protein
MMARLMNVRPWRQGPPGRLRGVAADARGDLQAVREDSPDFSYVPPRIMVVGRIRNLSTGSSSSGKSDANSQFYW